MLKSSLEKILRNSRSGFLRTALLKILYLRKGMLFRGFKKYYNRFYIFHVDNLFIPTEWPYWNVTYSQSEFNCRQYSLAFCQLSPGDTVVDIGAGLGEEMLVYATRVTISGKVICFEPLPEAFDVLKEVISLNHFSNVECKCLAIYHSNVYISLTDADESYDASYLTEAAGKPKDQQTEGITFNRLMQKVPAGTVKLLKVNIEGSERFLLNTDFVQEFERIENIAIACHDFRYKTDGNEFFKTKEIVMNFFSNHGFRVYHQNTGQDHIDDWVYGENKRFKPSS